MGPFPRVDLMIYAALVLLALIVILCALRVWLTVIAENDRTRDYVRLMTVRLETENQQNQAQICTSIETLMGALQVTDARITDFTHPAPQVVRVDVPYMVPVNEMVKRAVPVETERPTPKNPVHIILMDANESDVLYNDIIDGRRRSNTIEHMGAKFQCVSNGANYYIYRQQTQ